MFGCREYDMSAKSKRQKLMSSIPTSENDSVILGRALSLRDTTARSQSCYEISLLTLELLWKRKASVSSTK